MESKLKAIIKEQNKLNLMIEEAVSMGADWEEVCGCANSGVIPDSMLEQTLPMQNVVGM